MQDDARRHDLRSLERQAKETQWPLKTQALASARNMASCDATPNCTPLLSANPVRGRYIKSAVWCVGARRNGEGGKRERGVGQTESGDSHTAIEAVLLEGHPEVGGEAVHRYLHRPPGPAAAASPHRAPPHRAACTGSAQVCQDPRRAQRQAHERAR